MRETTSSVHLQFNIYMSMFVHSPVLLKCYYYKQVIFFCRDEYITHKNLQVTQKKGIKFVRINCIFAIFHYSFKNKIV